MTAGRAHGQLSPSHPPPRVLIAVVTAVAILVIATLATVGVVVENGTGADSLIVIPFGIAYGGVGALVVWRQPHNALGWLFLVTGAGSALGLLAQSIGAAVVPLGGTAPAYAVWAAWLSVVYVELVGLPIMLAFLLFPDGRLPSRRWRPVLYLVIADIVVGTTIVALSNTDFSDPTMESTNQNFPGLTFPLPLVDPHRLESVYAGYQVLEVVLVAVSALSLVARYRASGPTTRAQIRWVTLAAAVSATGFVLTVAFAEAYIVVAFALLFPLVPIACGVAILRYRLYDIDRLIGRTLSYGVVTGVVIGIYALVVTLLTTLLPSSSSLVVAGATLAAAAVVRPMLRRVRARVDRRFDRAHYDAQRTLEEFAVGLREQVNADLTEERLIRVVRATMDPSTVGLARAVNPVAR